MTEDEEIPMQYPANRPGWLGEWQPYPCGRCGKDVDDTEKHPCPRICTVHGVEH